MGAASGKKNDGAGQTVMQGKDKGESVPGRWCAVMEEGGDEDGGLRQGKERGSALMRGHGDGSVEDDGSGVSVTSSGRWVLRGDGGMKDWHEEWFVIAGSFGN
ncbi:hypothetical protein MRB53_024938 [Persea americana]|uniref:Uncharacterized protein n=1 Tax=Persea americana TaxID=3435 RepID=A0ACC2LE55_PERAE|nr:hypothetical protein MRB53_024938 [Persea americana]